MPVIDAPPTPMVSLGPGGQYLALVHHAAHPEVAMLARPYLALAGLRIDQRLRARRRLRRAGRLSVVRAADGTERYLGLPDGAQVGAPVWAADGRRFAFTVDRAEGVGVWIADAETGEAAEVPGLVVCDVLGGEPSAGGGTVRWSRDGRSLLVLASPADREALPEPAAEPRLEETEGKRSQLATYQDLLQTSTDEDRFEVLATSVPCRVDPASGERAGLGPPGLYYLLHDSPDGTHLLVQRLHRPFSFRVPWVWFARSTEVWDAAGGARALLADLPVSDEVPRQGVPVGPRLAGWEERAPASLLWAEALDGGDPVAPAEFRDRIFRLAAPFDGEPRHAFDLRHRCVGWYDLDAPGQVLMVEHDRDRRWLTTWWCHLDGTRERTVVFDRSADDAYGDPGTPLRVTHPDGAQTVLADGTAIYLRGDGDTPDGKRPFLDRFDLATGATARIHQSPPGSTEHVLGFTTAERDQVLLWHESPAEPPNLIVAGLGGAGSRAVTAWPDPHPQLTRITKRLVTHDRGDGVTLSGMLYLPPGHDPAVHGRLPLVIWAYPFDFGGADTAGQIRADSFEFTRITALGPVVFTLRGYAVLADATMPVIGDPETMNDTYLEQVTGAAKAHIRALDEAGIIDPSRVAVGGHSYGGFMTANLIAHTGAFAAGIARSGAYNRTLTPFGFQTERRSYWEAAAVYDQVSPFRYADRMSAPLLLIHGEEDANSGTFPIQSERLFQAIRGNGGTARLVMLPHEGHGYLARDSVMHVLAEELDWLERWLGPAPGQVSAGGRVPASARAPAGEEVRPAGAHRPARRPRAARRPRPARRARRRELRRHRHCLRGHLRWRTARQDDGCLAGDVHPRPALEVWLGAAGAFVVHVVIATTLGTVVFHLLAPQAVDAVVAVLFFAGAGLASVEAIREWRRKEDPEPPPVPPSRPGRTAATAFAVIFAAEWGDLTQLLTANLAVHYHAPLSVATGAILALWAVAAIAVTGGRWLGRVIDAFLIRVVTAVLLAGLGVYAALAALSLRSLPAYA